MDLIFYSKGLIKGFYNNMLSIFVSFIDNAIKAVVLDGNRDITCIKMDLA